MSEEIKLSSPNEMVKFLINNPDCVAADIPQKLILGVYSKSTYCYCKLSDFKFKANPILANIYSSWKSKMRDNKCLISII